ncbi:hypothetical protein ACHQM5_022698 [Ranunculus cassubicifolius]
MSSSSRMLLPLPPPPPPPPLPPKLRKQQLLPQRQRTNPAVWLCGFCCMIVSVLIILSGIATLIVFLVIKPRYPLFQVTSASLNSVYLDSGEYLNGDFSFMANFSNPNRKMDVRFEYMEVELYFSDILIGTQTLQPSFALNRNNLRQLQLNVHMISIRFYIRGRFRVRDILNGNVHFSYWLHGTCQLVMTAPPTGVLFGRSCTTKRGS